MSMNSTTGVKRHLARIADMLDEDEADGFVLKTRYESFDCEKFVVFSAISAKSTGDTIEFNPNDVVTVIEKDGREIGIAIRTIEFAWAKTEARRSPAELDGASLPDARARITAALDDGDPARITSAMTMGLDITRGIRSTVEAILRDTAKERALPKDPDQLFSRLKEKFTRLGGGDTLVLFQATRGRIGRDLRDIADSNQVRAALLGAKTVISDFFESL